ncbi:hypothetical protein B5F83_07100 [Muribaculum sp. An289]|nr:hypothetical protein B5F83_07100 [Muribaculum sp. An289]OUO42706.1 hypothetical protein B5F81_06585 [Muribaculum sp. An287]
MIFNLLQNYLHQYFRYVHLTGKVNQIFTNPGHFPPISLCLSPSKIDKTTWTSAYIFLELPAAEIRFMPSQALGSSRNRKQEMQINLHCSRLLIIFVRFTVSYEQ